MRGLEGSYLGGRPLVHGEAMAGPCPLVRLRHLAEQRHQRHHLGTFLETGCHRLVWFTSWSEPGTRSWWPPQPQAPWAGVSTHACERTSSHPDVSPSLGLRGASARPAAIRILSARRPGQAESFPEASQARVHRPGMDTHDSGGALGHQRQGPEASASLGF